VPYRQPHHFRRLLYSAVAVPLLLLLALALVLVLQLRSLLGAYDATARSDERLQQIERVRQLLVDRETGLRGYLLAGEPRFLEPFTRAGERLPEALSRLDGLLDRPEQHQRHAQLRAQWQDWEGVAQRELALKEAGGDYLALVRGDQGKQRMDRLRATLDEVEAAARERRARQAGRAQVAARRVLVGAGAAALLIGLGLAYVSRRQLLALARSYEAGALALQREQAALKRLNAELEARVAQRTQELSFTNRELETFSYSVSHDLRTPLRAIDGFSQALLEDEGERIGPEGQEHLRRMRAAAGRMGQLIDDLLHLSRVGRTELAREPVDLGALAQEVAAELQRREPGRRVHLEVQQPLRAQADPRLVRLLLENLLQNAWKFTSRREEAHIRVHGDGAGGYVVEDDGVGFDMAYAGKLFSPFQRLHRASEFPGTGIGLATVQRIVHRHGGTLRAEGRVGEGARFSFTLGEGGA
jgi:signal transduction histidine kinase